MTQEPNKKKIGLFLLLGIIAFSLIVGQSIISRFKTDDKQIAVMYFDESVKGLNVGSPVVFNGVEIGKVIKIELIANPQSVTFLVPVYVQLTSLSKMKKSTDWNNLWQRRNLLTVLVEKGLRARLQTQSYLTGQLMIELGMMPNTSIKLVNREVDKRNDIPEIPTVFSQTRELFQGVQNLPVKKTIDSLNNVLSELENNLPVILPALAHTSQNLEKITNEISPVTEETVNNIFFLSWKRFSK